MQTVSSAAIPDRENGTGHLPAFRAAAAGKLRGSNASRPPGSLALPGRLIFAVVVLFMAAATATPSHAQSGPFAGMAGVWSGAGTVTLDDGSTERIRCRETAASDSYKFDLSGNVVSDRGTLSGSWSESSRGITGSLEGRGASGSIQVVANAAGFTASLSVATRGNRQSVAIRAENGFRGASIALSRR